MTDREAQLVAERKDLRKTGVILVISFVVLMAALALFLFALFKEDAQRMNGHYFVGFAPLGQTELALRCDSVDLEDMTLTLSEYNARIYYSKLDEADRTLYRAFEVALENGWEEIYLDNRLLDSCRYSPYDVLILLALDSPFMEQNLSYGEGRPFSQIVSGFDLPFGSLVEGQHFVVRNFSPERLEKKKEAMEAAEEIAAALPTDSTLETAEAIFRYLTDHVAYTEESSFERSNYLYDALCRGESNCDGYTNSFSLLGRLAGLNVFEKIDPDDEGGSGHTWNCVEIDGIWYNLDVTFGQSLFAQAGDHSTEEAPQSTALLILYTTFGFPDSQQQAVHSFSELTPRCNRVLHQPDLILKSPFRVSCASVIAQVLQQSGKDWIIVVTDFSLDQGTIQELANQAGPLRHSFFAPRMDEIYYAFQLIRE